MQKWREERRTTVAVPGSSVSRRGTTVKPSEPSKAAASPIRSLLRRVGAAFGSPATEQALADVNRRLTRIERQLAGIEKIWQRTRHLEPAVQVLIRDRYLDPQVLPYPERLTSRRFRISSQNQEDGITLALLSEVGVGERRFIEIGSGLSGGNSGFLARECGWPGLMVDGHADHMVQVGRRFPTVTAVTAWVTRENINDLITSHGRGGEPDLFSLDLDGNDYWIWEAMTACSPRVVILEYNSMFGATRSVTVPYDPQFDRHRFHTMYYGASLTALARLSARKGYRLVAVEPTGVNAFFVRNDLAPHIPACDPDRAFHLLEKYDVLMQQGEDVYRYVEQSGLSLVEIE